MRSIHANKGCLNDIFTWFLSNFSLINSSLLGQVSWKISHSEFPERFLVSNIVYVNELHINCSLHCSGDPEISTRGCHLIGLRRGDLSDFQWLSIFLIIRGRCTSVIRLCPLNHYQKSVSWWWEISSGIVKEKIRI